MVRQLSTLDDIVEVNLSFAACRPSRRDRVEHCHGRFGDRLIRETLVDEDGTQRYGKRDGRDKPEANQRNQKRLKLHSSALLKEQPRVV